MGDEPDVSIDRGIQGVFASFPAIEDHDQTITSHTPRAVGEDMPLARLQVMQHDLIKS